MRPAAASTLPGRFAPDSVIAAPQEPLAAAACAAVPLDSLAVDRPSADVYVADPASNAIDRFDSTVAAL